MHRMMDDQHVDEPVNGDGNPGVSQNPDGRHNTSEIAAQDTSFRRQAVWGSSESTH